MRITESSLDLASSHTVSASLQGRRQVAAWDRSGRVDLVQDVKITLSGADAAERLRGTAQSLGAPGRGRAMPSGARTAAPHVAGPRAAAPALAHAAPPSAVAKAAASEDEAGIDRMDLANHAWLILLRLTGDGAAARELAQRIARLARALEPQADISQALQRLAAELAASAATSSAPAARAAAAQPAAAQAAPAEDWGYREDVSVTVTETERTEFAASGSVRTADGREISVAAAFELVRSESVAVSMSVRKGQAARDPLALSFSAAPPSLAEGTQQIDVDNDGEAETVAALAPTSAYLVRDLDDSGTIDSGAEMFGPTTDSGFAELAALDGDGNGWVDEGDAAFAQLALWSGNEGDKLVSLAEAGVGALAAQSVATQYEYGARTGALAASSVFLYEDGRAGIAGELKLYA
jgi:hypothetical protein